jgi:hypothetical protein
MRKTWIKVKRGILDPKHIVGLGQAWYLYFYILDQADWDTGMIPEWKDEYAAEDLNKQVGTIREHRKYLEGKYISCKKNQHSQTITIFNWTDPRRYDGEILNQFESTDFSEPLFESSPQSSPQTILVQAQNSVPSYSHITTLPHNKDIDIYTEVNSDTVYEPCDEDGNPIKERKKKKEPADFRFSHPAYVSYRRLMGTRPAKEMVDKIIELIGENPDELKLSSARMEWVDRGYNKQSYKWLEWYRDGIPARAFKKRDTATPTSEERKDYTKWEE